VEPKASSVEFCGSLQTLAVRVEHETASLDSEAKPVEPWATLNHLLRLYETKCDIRRKTGRWIDALANPVEGTALSRRVP